MSNFGSPRMRPPTVPEAVQAMEEIDPEKLTPLEYRVLLRINHVDSITQGGIIMPGTAVEKQLFGKTKGEIVCMGDEAFTGPSGGYISNKPEVGDTVITAKYAGSTYKDSQGYLYRFCNDKDIISIEEKGVANDQ